MRSCLVTRPCIAGATKTPVSAPNPAHRFAPVEVADAARVEVVVFQRVEQLLVPLADHLPCGEMLQAGAWIDPAVAQVAVHVAKIGDVIS